MKKLLLLFVIGFNTLSANSNEDTNSTLVNKAKMKTPFVSDEAAKFKMRNMQMQKEMKCGAAKCGNSINSSKCGAVKIPTH